MKKIKVLDFFSGCGRTSQGFHQAGTGIVFGLDFDVDAASSFRANFPQAAFISSDIRLIDNSTVNKLVEKYRNDYILFSGCMPCQPCSKQNSNKKNDDPRLDLLKEFSRFVGYYMPDFILVKNVPGMQEFDKNEGTFMMFLEMFSSKGYSVNYKVIPAAWYGVSQTRERLVLIASKDFYVVLPSPTHGAGNTPYSTVEDWIASLPKIEAGEKHNSIPDHEAARLSELNLRRIECIPEGGSRESWPDELILKCHRNHRGHTDVYGRSSWDKPASGLTTRCISYSNGRFGHPTQDRAISVREAACLQTSPLDYKFIGSLQSRACQVRNAVLPKISETIGKHLLNIVKAS